MELAQYYSHSRPLPFEADYKMGPLTEQILLVKAPTVAFLLQDSAPGFQQSSGKPNIEKIYKSLINI